MKISNLRDWTLDSIEQTFGLLQVRSLPILDELLAHKHEADAYEQRYLGSIREDYLTLGGDDWNEVELENKLISPLIVFSGISNQKYSYFLERELRDTIDDYEISGRVDGMIATGFRNPRKPYFCLSDGDPKGQALIAMLMAQHLNDNAKPIFGSYIIGRNWCFMALVGKEYAISTDFSCVDDEIFDIFRIMKSLRIQIEKLI
jgi:hypothetical protein